MAIKDRIVEIVYNLKDQFSKKVGAITGGMRDIERASDRTTAKLNANNKSSVLGFGSVGSALSKLSLGFVVFTATVGRAISVVKQAIAAANIQERAETKLETTLRNLTGATDEQIQALKDQASALQQTTGYGDEQTISAQAMLATFQLTAEQIQVLTPRLLDMAEAARKAGDQNASLETIAIAIGKAFSTGIGALSRYGVAMSDAQKESFKLADAQGKVRILSEVLDGNFKGLAESVGSTYEGAVRKAEAAQGDFYEKVGAMFTQNRAWIKLNELVTKSWESLSKGIDESGGNVAFVVGTIAKSLAVSGHLIREAFNLISITFKLFAASITQTIAGISSALSKLTFGEAAKRYMQFAYDMQGATQEILKGVREDWLDIGESTANLVKIFEETDTATKNTKKTFSDLGAQAKSTGTETTTLAEKTKALKDQLKEAAKNAVDEAKQLASVRKEAASTRASFADFATEIKSTGDAAGNIKLIDVINQMKQVKDSLKANDFDGAISGAEKAAAQIRQLKESGDQGNATLSTLADKLKGLVDQATSGKEQQEIVKAKTALSDVDALKAKVAELSGQPVDIKVNVDRSALDALQSSIKPIVIPVTYRVSGSVPEGLTPSGGGSSTTEDISSAANKGGS